MYGIGIDVGGTTVKFGLFQEKKAEPEKWEIKTFTGDVKRLYDDMAEAISGKLAELRISKCDVGLIGMAVPGPVDQNGDVSKLANLFIGAHNPKKEMESRLGIRTFVQNDADLAALGELVYGSSEVYNSAFMVTLGTGIGGGIVLDRKLWSGVQGLAGEIGHFIVNPDETKPHSCGACGCLEQYASSPALLQKATEILKEDDAESLLRGKEPLTVYDMVCAVKEEDVIALKVFDYYAKYLAMALSHIVLTIDPEVIIVGGGIVNAGKPLFDAIEKYLKKYLHLPKKLPVLRAATLGNTAGIYGAYRYGVQEKYGSAGETE